MGCSPSQAIIIQSSTTAHETVCLKPTIYMVSESTVKILQDVGELKVFHVDESDHGKIEEKYGHVGDQLANPLVYQPQVRSWRSAASGSTENTLLRGSTATIRSQQSLQNDRADSDIKLEENNSCTKLAESSEIEYKNENDILLSVPDKMQIKHVDTIETESTYNSAAKVRQSSGQENVEGNSSRNESKRAAQFNPKFMNQNKVTPRQSFEMSSLTPVECEKMVRYNSEFDRAIELASRFSEEPVTVEENEQGKPDLSDISDTEQETANNSTISENKEEETSSLAAAEKNNEKEQETELRKIDGNDKHANSNKGMLIKVKSLIFDDE